MFVIATVVAFLGEERLRRMGPLSGFVLALCLILLVLAASVIFNWQGRRVFAARTHDEYIHALESAGKLEMRPFEARRAFQVTEFEDEGSHYFLELEDRSVLYVTGQYLYEYEPMEADGDEPAQPRRFPCSRFVLRTNLHDGYTIDIVCAGADLEPEVVAPSFARADYRRCWVPGAGAIITDKTYDQLKTGRLAVRH